MITTEKSRAVTVATVAVVCLLGALTLAAVRTASGETARPTESPPAGQVPLSASGLAFHDAMRKLWEDHITYTRNVIISFEVNEPDPGTVLPDLNAVLDRLFQNQVDIGNAIKPFYGEAPGNQLSALLHDHIAIAGEILTALKTGDSAGLADAQKRWYDNANDIAAFLNEANPDNWPLEEMQQMMKEHLDATTAEAVARFNGNWSGDVAAYEKVHAQILGMADMLSNGIIAQFPSKFRP